jgi:digeranylgeranylglycerophospholipid reductase
MAKQYDVVIAGAGPAGLMAAKTASESGLRIALLERKTDISRVRRTDAGIIALNEYIYGQIVTFNRATQTLIFPVAGFTLKYEGPWNDNRYGFHFYSPGGKCFMVGDWAELKKDPVKNSRGVSLSKGRLLKGMLNEARANGVEYFPNTNVAGAAPQDDAVIVETDQGDFQGRFVVAADGVNSRIARALGLNKQRQFSGTSRYLTRVMTGVQPPEAEGLLFIMTMYGTFSISQVCTKDHFHVSIVTNDPKDEMETLLEKFTHDDPFFSPWFRNAKRADDDECCVVNTMQAIAKPFYRNVILVGDACWSYQFSNALALTAGYQLGHALTRAFLDGKMNEEGVAQYLEWYDTCCYQPYGQQSFGGGNLTGYLTSEELDYLAALPAEPAPPTASFSRVFHTILETYMPLSERIREDHPAILKKFKAMGEDMEKAQEEKRKAGFPNK